MLEVGWSLFIVASLVVATAAGVFAELLAGWPRVLLKQGHDRCPVMLILSLRLALEKRD